MRSPIEALGYLGLEVSDLQAWQRFAGDVLGLEALERQDGAIDLRMDDYATRIRLQSGPRDDLAYIGWEVRDAAALELLAQHLERAGTDVQRGNAALAADRRVAGLIRFSDPEGNSHEAVYGPLQKTNVPFVSPHGVRFKTGRNGLGHIVLSCRDKPAMMDFFLGTLGFRLSDHINTEVVPGKPLQISFMRCNGRHHSLALADVSLPKKIIHMMVETQSLDDVGRALQRCLERRIHLSFTLGRHSNDRMLSFYPLSPSGFDVEYGWGGLEVDDENWHVLTHDTNSAWGHIYQRPPRPAKPETRRRMPPARMQCRPSIRGSGSSAAGASRDARWVSRRGWCRCSSASISPTMVCCSKTCRLPTVAVSIRRVGCSPRRKPRWRSCWRAISSRRTRRLPT
jgi:2,3-dihydroxybiphenyl 1,2-dioxygenase